MGFTSRFLKFSGVGLATLCIFVGVGLKSQVVKADTTIANEGTIVRATSIVSNKVIRVPDKAPKQTAGSKNLSRGSSVGSAGAAATAGNNRIVSLAASKIGCPYVWGASGPKAFDCSGLVYYVFSNSGISIPRTSQDQYNSSIGTRVSRANLSPGDAVFFNTYGSISHVGIYIGGGRFIHAPSTGYTVTIANLDDGYYAQRFAGGKRFSN